jgi:sucrose-6-phosphate hydrolase SacC (GH32 family)
VYTPRGFGSSELGDIDMIEHRGRLHVLHLVLPNHDRVAHIVSDDGLHWTALPDALRTGDPGEFDDDMIWTMGVVRFGGAFHMLYTGLCTAESGAVQRIGHAVSDDLVTWHKRGLVLEAAAPFERGSWRDPKPIAVGDEVLVPICARIDEGPSRWRGCVALASTRDFETFTVEPLFRGAHAYEVECPQLYPLHDRWVLLGSLQEDRSVRCWVGESPRGPFTTPPCNRLLPAGHYAAKLFRWRDQDWALGWYDRPRVLPSPLPLRGLTLADEGTGSLPWTDEVRSRHGAATVPGPEHAADFRIAGTLHVDATRVALGFGDHWRVELDPGDRRIRLKGVDGRVDERVVQDAPMDRFPERISVRVRDGEVTVALDGTVALFAVIDAGAGRLSLLVDSGTARISC